MIMVIILDMLECSSIYRVNRKLLGKNWAMGTTMFVFSHFSFLARLREKNRNSREKKCETARPFLKGLEDFLHNSTRYFLLF